MTKQEFDDYRFSVNTEINYFEDVWDGVTEVDFYQRCVGITRGQYIWHDEIKSIREANK